jgi:UDP-N-acetylmuramoyl-tripeptide--D-alanyl-D-alanine ligase
MIGMQLSEAARLLNAQHHGADVVFSGISTDTRTLKAQNLFVALQGTQFDGHHFLRQAGKQGAAAVLVSQLSDVSLPALEVVDTRRALGRLASVWRRRFSLPLIAVTGSNGKTTVKEMVAAILKRCGTVLVTQGNLNNDIGLPLTLLQLDVQHRYAVIEMGANHSGEIANLTDIAAPTVGLITNAGPAHLEGFGTLEGVARAKGELFAGLSEQGIAVLNHDDPHAPLWRELIGKRRSLSFGLQHPADVSAEWEPDAHGSFIRMSTPQGRIETKLPLPGGHNVLNALAASAAALAAGAKLTDIQSGLETMQSVAGRLQIKPGIHDSTVIDDTYNANPASLAAAIEVLAKYPTAKWLVLGDMAELGTDAALLHEQAGRQARALSIDRLFACGDLSRGAVQHFSATGQHFATQQELINALQSTLKNTHGVTLLVKGSRSAQMEHVVTALTQQPAGNH